jgi:DNA invertase Pin-like site-specific DNA recombinase
MAMLHGVDLKFAKMLYDDGWTIEEVGRKLGVTTAVAGHSLKLSNTEMRPAGKPAITAEQKKRMKQLKRKGHGDQFIADAVGCSRSAVYTYLSRGGKWPKKKE